MQKFYKYILIIVIISQSCNFSSNDESFFCKSAVNHNYVFADLKTSSFKNKKDELFWKSQSAGQNGFLIFEFQHEIYIKNLNLASLTDNFYKKINKISVFTHKGKNGIFEPNQKIEINDSLIFLIVKVERIENFSLANGYKEGVNYKLDLKKNTKVAIKSIFFEKNDSVDYKICLKKDAYLPNYNEKYWFVGTKFTDYTNANKSIIFMPNNTFSFFSEKNNKTQFVLGGWEIISQIGDKFEIKLSGENYNFENDIFSKKEFSDKITLDKMSAFGEKIGTIHFDFPADAFIDLQDLDSSFVIDVRYATTNNFTETQLYDCPKCLLRYSVAKKLVEANQIFQKKGFRLKIFDAYRPFSVQVKMWEACPNINFVAPPERGSIHNRGGAVDVTLVDSLGNQLDMGTPYDFLGYRAYTTNFDLPDTVLTNRHLLQSVLDSCGFMKIKTEWWHFSHRTCMKYPIEDFPLPCQK